MNRIKIASIPSRVRPGLSTLAAIAALVALTACGKKEESAPSAADSGPAKPAARELSPQATTREAKNVFREAVDTAGEGAEIAAEGAPEVTAKPGRWVDPPTPEAWSERFQSARTVTEKVDIISRAGAVGPEEAVAVVRRGIRDSSPIVRYESVIAATELDPPEFQEIAKEAIKDPDAEVRMEALDANLDLDEELDQLAVLEEAIITSTYEDVREEVLTQLADLHTPEALVVLFEGLKDNDPLYRDRVNWHIDFMIERTFDTHDQAMAWWQENVHRYDEDLLTED